MTDAHVAHRFASGPAPFRSWALIRCERQIWGRSLVACLIAMTLVEALIQVVGPSAATEPLLAWHRYAVAAC